MVVNLEFKKKNYLCDIKLCLLTIRLLIIYVYRSIVDELQLWLSLIG